MVDLFARCARSVARQSGQPAAFMLASLSIVAWAAVGPVFSWSDSWQLVINTGTTIITFLMVFLIQNAQNCDNQALQLKLDELILATSAARNTTIDLEGKTEQELQDAREEIVALSQQVALRRAPSN
jgi:low affinity Fe/Cu permease